MGAGDLRSTVAERLRLAGVPARLIDKLPQEDLAHEYRRAHVLLLTSLREGFNQATLEAMASGTPVVASDIPGVRDGVGDAGLLARPGDAAGFADHVEALASDASRWDDLRRRSLEQAGHFTWPEIVADFDAVYRRAIDRRAGRR